jgi:endonuclease/exonuclease/phosphatase family metal-dependent hydrolase
MDPFRLASYNVKCFPWCSVPIKEIVQWITQHADIVALQEVWCQHALWSTAFTAHGWTFLRPARESHFAAVFGSGLAVAWRSDIWQLSDARLYPYLSAVGFDALVTKGWFRVELKQRKTGAPLRLIDTHMQSDYEVCDELWRPIAEPVRMAQALQLYETESRMPPIPTLIIGDMNTEMCWIHGYGYLTQHAGPTFERTSQVLDHCAALNGASWNLLQHRVGRECGDWSDHWPVLWHLQHQVKPPATPGKPPK